MTGYRAPVVFAGPTISPADVRAIVPAARVLPPVRRGDLYRERNAGAATFLVIDGSFSHGFAVSPGEVVDVARDGARIYGCSSMGAIRAAECWPAGVAGVGVVYRLYRLGILSSDDEVAVATDADNGHAAISCALVNMRYTLRRGVARQVIGPTDERVLLERARDLHFTERTWPRVFDGRPNRLEEVDVKRADAIRALRLLVNADQPEPHRGEPLGQRSRYRGHDRLLGRAKDQLRRELLRWLFGSGRYQRYIWPIAAGTSRAPAGSPENRQEFLITAIQQMITDEERLSTDLWEELDYLEELDSELLTWHAANELASRCADPIPAELIRGVREEVAVRHGAPNWATLQTHVTGGLLFDAVPMTWVNAACDAIAAARLTRRLS